MKKQRCANKLKQGRLDAALAEGLTRLFTHQAELIKVIDLRKGTNFQATLTAGVTGKGFQQALEHLLACLSNELEECRDWTAWKPWKTYAKGHNQRSLKELQFEVIDLLHFWVELAMLTGLDGNLASRIYLEKHRQNHQRQVDGY